MRRSALAGLLVPALLLARGGAAHACGSSGPGGVSACSLAEHEEDARPRWRLGVSGVYTATAIHFSSALRADETRGATLVELGYAPTDRLTLSAGLGATFGGRLLAPDGAHPFTPGLAAGLGASYRLVAGDTPLGRGFVLVSAALSFTAASTQFPGEASTGYEALDLRLGAAGGFSWWNALSVYGLARGFGGPVYWRYLGAAQTGTDVHHYQLGIGGAFLVARRLDIFFEGVPVGEVALAGGAIGRLLNEWGVPPHTPPMNEPPRELVLKGGVRGGTPRAFHRVIA